MSETSPSDDEGYVGASNLEVMAVAKRYNAFLENMVINASGGAETALDFGAGGGEFARRTASHELTVTCVEPDTALRERLKREGFETAPDLSGIGPASRPYIYTLNVLEHIEDDVAALRDLFERVAPGGTLFIYVPAYQMLYGSMDRLVGHYRRYTLSVLSKRVEAAGFAIQDSGYADPVGFFAALAHKFIGSDSGEISDRSVALFDTLAFPVSRALHRVTKRWFGKNVWVRARKPA